MSDVQSMNTMFKGASSVDQNLDNWDVTGMTSANSGMFQVFDRSGLATSNYDSTLIGWSTLSGLSLVWHSSTLLTDTKAFGGVQFYKMK